MVLFGIVLLLSVLTTLSTMATSAIAITIAVIVFFFLRKNEKNDDEEEADEKPLSKDGETMDWQSEVSSEKAYKYLMVSNFTLRSSDGKLTAKEIKVFEDMIDNLRNLILMLDTASTVLKWKVNQISIEFIPKLSNKYLLANPENRKVIMETTVNDINTKVSEIETVISNNNNEEFEHYATTLQKIMNA